MHPRLARALRPALALAALGLLGACGAGGGDASQDDVQDSVADLLEENGFEGADLSGSQIDAASSCISRQLFESDAFDKDDRNAIAKGGAGDAPDPELVARFEVLVDSCLAEVLNVGPVAPTDEGDGGDEG